MYKIVIIDDEEWIRQGLVNKINNSGLGFCEVAEAENADEGLDVIKRIRPEIVICDIRMQEMDGLELSAIVNRTFPDVKIIIISGYDEFDYAKKALQLGVVDYLLKPINSFDLYNSLKKSIELIEKESHEQKSLRKMTALEQLNEVRSTLKKNLNSKEDNYRDIFSDYKQGHSLFKCVYLYIDKQLDLNRSIVVEHIFDESRTWECYRNAVLYENNINEYVAIFCTSDSENINFYDKLVMNSIAALKRKIQDLGIFQYTFGISDYRNNLHEAITEATNAMKCRMLVEENNIIHYNDTKIFKNEFKLQPLKATLIKHNIETQQYKNLSDILKDIYEEVTKSPVSYSSIQNLYTNFLMIALIDFNMELENKLRFYPKEAYYFNCIKDMFNFIKGVYSSIINTTYIDNKDFKKELIYEVKEYIDLNYHKSITLKSIASMQHINSCYLSILFKEILNVNFQDYLMSVRINNAKILLNMSKHKIKQIANMTGFTDEHYFSKVFKKIEGVTPKQFINKMEKGNTY